MAGVFRDPRRAGAAPVVDAQIHLWEPSRPDRPWPTAGVPAPHGPARMGAQDALAAMDAAGVDAALLVPPSFEGDRNDVVIAAARAHPRRFKALGRLALDRPEAPRELDALLAEPGVLGVRVTVNGGSASWLRDGTLTWFWRTMAERGAAVSIFAPTQVDALAPVAREHPALRLSVDHLGLHPTARDGELAPVIEQLCALARYENVAVKASALPIYVTEPYPFASLAPLLRRVVGAFGSERVFWGSDLTRLRCGYREALDYAPLALAGLGEQVVHDVMGRALLRWLGWEDGHRGT
jgi:L-fuconolactonase